MEERDSRVEILVHLISYVPAVATMEMQICNCTGYLYNKTPFYTNTYQNRLITFHRGAVMIQVLQAMICQALYQCVSETQV